MAKGLWGDGAPDLKGIKRYDGSTIGDGAEDGKEDIDRAEALQLAVLAVATQMLQAVQDLAAAVRETPVVKPSENDPDDEEGSAHEVEVAPVVEAYRQIDLAPVVGALEKMSEKIGQAAGVPDIKRDPASYRVRIERDGRGRLSELYFIPIGSSEE